MARAWRLLVFFGVPLVFLPLPLLTGTKEAGAGYVLIVTIIFFLTDPIPLCMSALLPLVLYPLLGVHSAQTVASWAVNDSTILLTGNLIVGLAIEAVNLHTRIGLRILLILGPRPERILLAIICMSFFLSMWLADITVIVMLMPMLTAIVQALSSASELAVQETPSVRPELSEKSKNIDHGLGTLRPVAQDDAYAVPALKPGLTMALLYGATFGGMTTLVGSYPSIIIKQTVDQLYGDAVGYDFPSHMAIFFPIAGSAALVTWLSLTLTYAPDFVRQLWRKPHSHDEGMFQRQARLMKTLRGQHMKLGYMTCAEVSVSVIFLILVALWLLRDPPSFPGWIQLLPKRSVSPATVVLFVALILFVWPTDCRRLWETGENEPLIKWHPTMTEKFPWSILFFAMGLNVISQGSEVGGLSDFVAALIQPLSIVPPLILIIILMIVVTVLTELMNKALILLILLPILAKFAEQGRINPLLYMLPTTVAAMLAFMTPISSGITAFVYGTGTVTVKQMLLTGIVPKISAICFTVLYLSTIGDAVFSAWRFLVFFGAPLVFLPLPLLVGTKVAGAGYVLIVTVIFFISDVIPLCMSALVLPLVLYPLLGVHSALAIASWTVNDSTLLLVGSLIVGLAIESANLHTRLGLKTLLILGPKPERILLAIICMAFVLSMWIADITVVVMLMPMLGAIQHQLAAAADLVTKDHGAPAEDSAKKVPDLKPALTMALLFGATFGGMTTPVGSYPGIVLKQTVDQLYGDAAGYDFASHMAVFTPVGLTAALAAWLSLTLTYAPGFVSQLWKRQQLDQRTVIFEESLLKTLHSQYAKLGPMNFAEKSVTFLFCVLVALWLFRDPPSFPGWISVFPQRSVSSGTVAMIVAIVMFVWPSDLRKVWQEGKNDPLIKWRPTMTEKFPWGILFLAMGLNVLSNGSEVGGLSDFVADLIRPMASLPPYALIIILMLIITTLTEVMSTGLILLILLPILAKFAEHEEINPLFFMLPATMAAMVSFMTPISSSITAYIHSTGTVTVKQMLLIGIIPKLSTFALVVFYVSTVGDAVFAVRTFPSWAAANRTVLSG